MSHECHKYHVTHKSCALNRPSVGCCLPFWECLSLSSFKNALCQLSAHTPTPCSEQGPQASDKWEIRTRTFVPHYELSYLAALIQPLLLENILVWHAWVFWCFLTLNLFLVKSGVVGWLGEKKCHCDSLWWPELEKVRFVSKKLKMNSSIKIQCGPKHTVFSIAYNLNKCQ